jgi:hypothetical protein
VGGILLVFAASTRREVRAAPRLSQPAH